MYPDPEMARAPRHLDPGPGIRVSSDPEYITHAAKHPKRAINGGLIYETLECRNLAE